MKHLKTIMLVFVALAALSCSKQGAVDKKGQICFEVSSNDAVADVTRSNVSDYTTLPSRDNFTIVVKDADQVTVYDGQISAWDAATLLPEGNYSVTASYGSLEEEGFDEPFFIGTQSFTITGGEVTNVSIPVSLGNTVVKMSYSDAFKNYYKDYTFTLSRDGSDIVTFTKDETKAAFIDGYKFTISGVLTGEMKTYTFSNNYTNFYEATAYTFHFDVNNVGGSSIIIRFKEGYAETIELGTYELND